MDLKEVNLLSKEIRNKYFELEKEIHGSVWSVEEDALAFLTDAGLVGRLTMDNQGRCLVQTKNCYHLKSVNVYGG